MGGRDWGRRSHRMNLFCWFAEQGSNTGGHHRFSEKRGGRGIAATYRSCKKKEMCRSETLKNQSVLRIERTMYD